MNVEARRRMIACFMSSRMIFPMSFRGIRSSSISRSVDAKSDGLDIPFDPGPESSQTRHFTQLKHRMPQARKQLASVAGGHAFRALSYTLTL